MAEQLEVPLSKGLQHRIAIVPDLRPDPPRNDHPRRLKIADVIESGAGKIGTALLKRALEDAAPDVLDAAIDQLRAAVEATSAADVNALSWQANLGAALRTRYQRTEQLADLNEAIDMLQTTVAASDQADPQLVGRLGNLGVALRDRFEVVRDPHDLTAAIEALERAVATTGSDQPVRQAGNLAAALLDRYEITREETDLEHAIHVGLRAVETAGTASTMATDRAAALANLGAALFARFERRGGRTDLDSTLKAAEAAVTCTGPAHPKRALYLSTLGTLRHTRYVQTGERADLNAAIAALSEAEPLSRSHRVGRALCLSALGNSLFDRYRQLGDAADLKSAIVWHRAAVQLTPDGSADLPGRLSNLAVALAEQAERDPGSDAVEEALRLHDRAVRLAGETDPHLASIVANRGGAFLSRFSARGEVADCSAAVTAYRRALGLVSDHRLERARHLAQLGQSLRARHQATGSTVDLYEAVTVLRESVDAVAPEHPDRAMFCSYLAAALRNRHSWHGSAADLDEAIQWHEQAAASLPVGHVGRTRLLASRAFALRVRAERTRDPAEVTAAVEAARLVVETEPDTARQPDLLAALGSALALREDNVADITETINVRRKSSELTAPDDPHRGPRLADLASSLRARAKLASAHAGDADLEEAHRLHLAAVEMTPAEDPEYATVLSNLAGSFRDRFVRHHQRNDLHAALQLLRQAAELPTAPLTRRVVAAHTWGRLAADTGEWVAAREGYALAISLLPAAVWRGVERVSQEQLLRDTPWLAAEAAACALNLDDPVGAIDLLERGRTVLWNQRLETATDLDQLRALDAELADRMASARAVLDTAHAEMTNIPPRVDARIAAAADWDAAITELRARPELADLFPGPAPPTAAIGLDGTVIVLTVSRYRCDALFVDRNGTRNYELTHLDLHELADHVAIYFGALATIVDSDATPADRQTADVALGDVLRWLWQTVAATIIDKIEPGTRVWWCPTGPFTYLPLHAAGQVPDKVISSYTPTIGSLLRAWSAPTDTEQRILGVAAPYAPDLPPLPATPRELAGLARTLPPTISLTRLEGPSASRDAVRTALGEHTWAHLACHGEQNLADPSHAALALTDGLLRITEIATRSGYHAEGAYLSACQTALGGVQLTDEVLHLAAALQYAGFRRVIATLWPIGDTRAQAVARSIYTTLVADGTFRPDLSAAAVRDVTLTLRARFPRAPSQWAPYLHIGP